MPKPMTFKAVYTAVTQYRERGRAGQDVRRMGRLCRAQPQAARATVESAGKFERHQEICRLLARGGGWCQPRLRCGDGAWIDAAED
jgi:hypothetical protein